jgi:hypothetical protein
VLAQGAGRLIRTKDDRVIVAVLYPRLAKQTYRTQLLTAMPPLRRSVDLAEACAFLEEVAAAAPTASAASVAAGERASAGAIDPSELRHDISGDAAIAIRNFFPCSVCDAKVTERCRDNDATSAYLHEARVRAATG